MKVSWNWLKTWVNPELTVEQVSDQLTFAGVEVDELFVDKPNYDGVVVAQIKNVESHPNADQLRICHVDAGDNELRQIVCGAENVYASMKAPLALPGAHLGEQLIKHNQIRGVKSEGMLCSASELGYMTGLEGILELNQDAPVAIQLTEYLQAYDTILDIDLTPNRGDCLSVLGLAREVAAITNITPPRLPQWHVKPTIQDTMSVNLEDDRGCPGYCGRLIRHVDAQALTPLWMQQRLRQVGVAPVNLIVDVTNYVMFELGQPLHAFDAEKLAAPITIRRAEANDSLTLLNGETETLAHESLVIADNQQPVALAGVMGGYHSAVSLQTQTIFLESAHFDHEAIARNAQDNQIWTDSSARFERGVDWNLPAIAIERASELIVQLAGGQPGPVQCVWSDNPPSKHPIELNISQIEKVLGTAISQQQCENYLRRLQMSVQSSRQSMTVTPPSYRFDLTRPIDLIEEVIRLHGYHTIPSQLPQVTTQAKSVPSRQIPDSLVRTQCHSLGYDEIINYVFVDQRLQSSVYPDHNRLTLLNPIAQDMAELRAGLWPGMINTIAINQHHQYHFLKLFEIGACFVGSSTAWSEVNYLGLALTSQPYPDQWGTQSRSADFYDLKADVEQLLQKSGRKYTFRQCEHAALHPGQSAAIDLDSRCIGYMGALHPRLAQNYDLNEPVLLAELLWDELKQTDVPTMKPINRNPSVKRDLALIVEDRINYGDLEQFIWQIAPQVLKNIQIFDIYRGEKLGEGKKSFALRLTFQHATRTLVDQEVNEITQTMVEHIQHQFAATLRGPANGNN